MPSLHERHTPTGFVEIECVSIRQVYHGHSRTEYEDERWRATPASPV